MLVRRFLLGLLCYVCCALGIPNDNASKLVVEDDYYINYDYDVNTSDDNSRNKALDSNSNYSSSTTSHFKPDSLILPNPDSLDFKYTVDVLPNIELPDDSLADPDLKDHDFIDNLMYVYYGPGNRTEKYYVSEIVIISSVLNCAIQSLTLFSVLLKKYYKGRRRAMLYIASNIFGSLFLLNLIFMLGVYATKKWFTCLIIAFSLNFLYTHTAIWIMLYSYYITRRYCGQPIFWGFKVSHLHIITCSVALTIALVAYFAIPNGYETKRYCFVSLYGMFFTLSLPTGIFSYTTMHLIYSISDIDLQVFKTKCDTKSIRFIKHDIEKNYKEDDYSSDSENETDSLNDTSSCLRMICLIQWVFIIFGFVTPVVLKYGQDYQELFFFQLVASALLNLFIFFQKRSLLPAMEYTLSADKIVSDQTDEDTLLSFVTNLDVSSAASSDNIPLLNSDNATEMKELGKTNLTEVVDDPPCETNISTISS